MGNNTPQLNRNLTQGTQLPSHITPTTGVPTMSLHTPPSPSRYAPIQICCGLRFHAHLQSWLPIVFEQGDVADEFEEHAESLSGRSRHRDERQDQQYGQLGVGQSQPQFAQYHLYAQTATSTPALHYQQVDPAPLTRVQLSGVFSAVGRKFVWLLPSAFAFSLQHVGVWYEPQSGFWDE